MDVIYLLINEFWTIWFLSLIILSPELIIFVSTVFATLVFEDLKHPVFAAFLFVSNNGFDDLLTCKLFKIS